VLLAEGDAAADAGTGSAAPNWDFVSSPPDEHAPAPPSTRATSAATATIRGAFSDIPAGPGCDMDGFLLCERPRVGPIL
jgi:hypothetical protein